eukprot:CAMPEP_0184525388 /NCGR_PEP_ID=MMETSP0198_2-20121128/10070_1 /TAXON_ID=1112570 /ORGANISM="Thraustochytrium sp., Strain LLF1b" /LENGTH=215 /DNA_ID=CAMNT_0026916841 /DNA_START=292 /DNA_END=939 /DNA_ORIENTATION=+
MYESPPMLQSSEEPESPGVAKQLISTPWDELVNTKDEIQVVNALEGSPLSPPKGSGKGLPLCAELLRVASIQRDRLYNTELKARKGQVEDDEDDTQNQYPYDDVGFLTKKHKLHSSAEGSSLKKPKTSAAETKSTQKKKDKPQPERHTSRFRGVCWYKRTNRWVVQLKVRGVRRHVGYFEDELQAAAAYDRALQSAEENPDDPPPSFNLKKPAKV